MELWDILDKTGRLTGRTVERGKPMTDGDCHLVVDVWIRNSAGQYLISKRAPLKSYPNMWETTGGAAVTGDSSLAAALREVKEELGLALPASDGKMLFRTKRERRTASSLVDVWLFHSDADIRDVVCQKDEVADAKWVSPEEIRIMIRDGIFVDVFTYIDRVFTS